MQENNSNSFDPVKIRNDFPILKTLVRGKPLVFLDSAASSQKPQVVIDKIKDIYENGYANIHRGVYQLSSRATDAFEGTRVKLARFINAREASEIIFVRGTTEAINLVASSYGGTFFEKGDEVILTAMEHHANIVPWQLLRDKIGIVIKVVPMNCKGELMLEAYNQHFSERTKLVGIAHVSNSLGTINPVKKIIGMAHERGIPVLVDGAQSSPHIPVDVQDLDADFYTMSAHKMYGPSGVGALYGKREFLEKMPPYQGGGDMITYVSFLKTLYAEIPSKFEAGTPDIAGIIGWGAAIDYLSDLGMENVHAYGNRLLSYGTKALEALEGVNIIGTAENKVSIISFLIDGAHPHDIGTILDMEGIAVRTGHHCAQPVMDFYKIPATSRASLSIYNNEEDIDNLVAGIKKVIEVFK